MSALSFYVALCPCGRNEGQPYAFEAETRSRRGFLRRPRAGRPLAVSDHDRNGDAGCTRTFPIVVVSILAQMRPLSRHSERIRNPQASTEQGSGLRVRALQA